MLPLFHMFRSWFLRIFRTRNIIIISEHKVRHMPVSGRMQCGIALATIAVMGWACFTTGTFVASHDMRKEKTLAATTPQPAQLLLSNTQDPRVAQLQQRVAQLEKDKQMFLDTVRITTNGKIDAMKEIISTTGLNPDTLSKQASKKTKVVTKDKTGANNQGGPFVPVDPDFQKKQEALIGQLNKLMNLHDVISHMPLARPIHKAQTMSGFGTRSDPFTRRTAMHTGMDFSGPSGSKIYATNAGVVTFAGYRREYGNMVDIDHGYGLSTRYGHMSSIAVARGGRVKLGQNIGMQGSTGRSTGPHLHYEVRYNDRPLNPKKFLDAAGKVQDVL